MNEPPWMATARADIGIKEIPGKDTLPAMKRWLMQASAYWHDDETPWCGTWLNHVFEDSIQLEGPAHCYRARAWLPWGIPLGMPTLGCVAVLNGGARGAGTGHVGLVVGRDRFDNLMLLGGNQRDQVCVLPFQRTRLLEGGLRWPDGQPTGGLILPLLLEGGMVSTSEG